MQRMSICGVVASGLVLAGCSRHTPPASGATTVPAEVRHAAPDRFPSAHATPALREPPRNADVGHLSAKEEAALAAAKAVLNAPALDAGTAAAQPPVAATQTDTEADAGVAAGGDGADASGELFVAACIAGAAGNGMAILIGHQTDQGLQPAEPVDDALAHEMSTLSWYRPDSRTPIRFEHPRPTAESRQVEEESAEGVTFPKIVLGSCAGTPGELVVLATRPLVPAVWERLANRRAEIPENARPDNGPEALTLPYRQTATEAPSTPEIDLSVRHLAGTQVYELRGSGPADCWSLANHPDDEPACTPSDPSVTQQSIDSREEGWARLGSGPWIGVRHVFASGPEGAQEELEAIELSERGASKAQLVLSNSTD